MPFGFRRRFRVRRLPRANFSKRGLSLSGRLGRFSSSSGTRRLRVSSPNPVPGGSPTNWSVGGEPVTTRTAGEVDKPQQLRLQGLPIPNARHSILHKATIHRDVAFNPQGDLSDCSQLLREGPLDDQLGCRSCFGLAIACAGPEMQPVRVTSRGRAAAQFSGEVSHGRVADDGSRRVAFDEAVAQSPDRVAGEVARRAGNRTVPSQSCPCRLAVLSGRRAEPALR